MSGDDTFDNPMLGHAGPPEPPKLPALRTFKVTRPGREDLIVEAHAVDRDGTTVAFIVIELIDGTTPVQRIRYLVTCPDMEVQDMIEFNGASRILS